MMSLISGSFKMILSLEINLNSLPESSLSFIIENFVEIWFMIATVSHRYKQPGVNVDGPLLIIDTVVLTGHTHHHTRALSRKLWKFGNDNSLVSCCEALPVSTSNLGQHLMTGVVEDNLSLMGMSYRVNFPPDPRPPIQLRFICPTPADWWAVVFCLQSGFGPQEFSWRIKRNRSVFKRRVQMRWLLIELEKEPIYFFKFLSDILDAAHQGGSNALWPTKPNWCLQQRCIISPQLSVCIHGLRDNPSGSNTDGAVVFINRVHG